ncbi:MULTISPECIES: TfoX/Sxy family protein [unclassified Roseitalea]|uniref:TfoX/Sxy family protein n=1 Tax=unclassified Roseitalea TaxID=2639107 RepID=UPI00273D613B|nr:MULTISPECIES: TfoX/Sxy family protein [unclassified Roseitalea]
MDDAFLIELFAPVCPVTVRRMFGGQGIYCPAGICAVVVDGALHVKGDDVSAPRYEAAGMTRWTYTTPRTGRHSSMPYWQVPDEALDSPEAMAPWARLAMETAERAQPASAG